MNEIQEGIKAFGEIAVKPLLALAFGSGFLIFAPVSILGPAGMTELVSEYRPWVGGTFTLSCAYLLAHAVKYLTDSLRGWQAARSLDKQRTKWLASLTPDEKGRLIPYIRDERASVTFPIEDGVVGGLQRKGILYRASNLGHAIRGFPYNLQPWAREALLARPEFLDGAEEVARGQHDWMAL
ncbi:superinfection exclusion B family protein [Massilia horti]|uniref:superinfection exclusion B family protein n=1 Tax=Massilia horti TaxID=2562153 RepID=UPI001E587FEA|nr:superinfection exclusion B family protein [Massilia horti]